MWGYCEYAKVLFAVANPLVVEGGSSSRLGSWNTGTREVPSSWSAVGLGISAPASWMIVGITSISSARINVRLPLEAAIWGARMMRGTLVPSSARQQCHA